MLPTAYNDIKSYTVFCTNMIKRKINRKLKKKNYLN